MCWKNFDKSVPAPTKDPPILVWPSQDHITEVYRRIPTKCQKLSWIYLPLPKHSHRHIQKLNRLANHRDFYPGLYRSCWNAPHFIAPQNFIWYMIRVSTHKNIFISDSKAQCACPFQKSRLLTVPALLEHFRQTPWLEAIVLYVNVSYKQLPSFFFSFGNISNKVKCWQKCIRYISYAKKKMWI